MKRSYLLLFLLCCLPTGLIAQGNLDDKKRELAESKDISEKVELVKSIIQDYLKTDRKTDSAFAYIDQLESLAKLEKDSLLFARVYQDKAHAYYLKSEFDLTEQYSAKAISIYKTRGETKEIALVNYVLGNSYQVIGLNMRAIEKFMEAEPYLTGGDLVMVKVGLGAAHSQLHDLETSLDYYNQAFNIANELGTRTYHYDIYNGLATVHERNGDNDKALESMKNALKEAIASRDALAQVVCYHNIGYLLKAFKQYEEARVNYEQGIALVPQISARFMEASLYMNYAETLYLLDEVALAEEKLNNADAIYLEVLPPGDKSTFSLLIRAKIEEKKGDYSRSIAMLEEAIYLSSQDEPNRTTQYSYEFLSQIYEKLDRPVEALEAYKSYEAVKDTIQRAINVKELEAQKAKFELAEYQQELKVKDQELILLEQKQKTSNYRNILLGVLSVGLVFFIYRQRKLNQARRRALETENELIGLKEEQLQMEMKYKNTEITDFALQISERNKLLETFTDRIREIKKQASSEIKKQLSELQMFIGNHMEVHKAKVSLNKKAEEAQESFRYKLFQGDVQLSPKETQVATYLRLNLPSKQIATQMGIAEQSVNNYRRSIRKKFGLTKDDNLVAFLKSI